jgi:glycosyltransferase involved in cell wall biosynthesis
MPERTGVTVVIPTRNRRSFLEEAVASVRRQTLADVELIVIDDASEDDTPAWLEAEGVPFHRMTQHEERSVARNEGLRRARNARILFLDDDDLLRPRALELLSAALDREPSAVAAIGGASEFDSEGHRQRMAHPKRSFTRSIRYETIFGWASHPGRTLFSTEEVRRCGGFPRGLVVGEDRYVLLRISARGPVVFVADEVLEHRVHPTQWRPADTEARELEITRRYLQTLTPGEANVGERIMRARIEYDLGSAAWDADDPRRAFRHFVRMRHVPRELMFSPVLRNQFTFPLRRGIWGAIAGPRFIRSARRTRARLLRLLGREVWRVPRPQRVEHGPAGEGGGR